VRKKVGGKAFLFSGGKGKGREGRHKGKKGGTAALVTARTEKKKVGGRKNFLSLLLTKGSQGKRM